MLNVAVYIRCRVEVCEAACSVCSWTTSTSSSLTSLTQERPWKVCVLFLTSMNSTLSDRILTLWQCRSSKAVIDTAVRDSKLSTVHRSSHDPLSVSVKSRCSIETPE